MPTEGQKGAALVVRGLRKSYGDVVAVDGVDLEMGAQECFGLLGPNGAGKTTTIEICEGLLERPGPSKCSVALGDDASAAPAHRHLAPGNAAFRQTDVRETLALFRSFYDIRTT